MRAHKVQCSKVWQHGKFIEYAQKYDRAARIMIKKFKLTNCLDKHHANDFKTFRKEGKQYQDTFVMTSWYKKTMH